MQELTEEDFPSGPSHATAPVPIHTLHHDTKDVAPCKTLLTSRSSSQDAMMGAIVLQTCCLRVHVCHSMRVPHTRELFLPSHVAAAHRAAAWREQHRAEKQRSSPVTDHRGCFLGFVWLCVHAHAFLFLLGSLTLSLA